MQLNLKAINIIQCLHAQQLYTSFKILYVQQFLFCLLPHAFFVCAHGSYDSINSNLTQIFMSGTVNVKAMLLRFLSVYKQLSVH